jgi:hypothetical protein
MSLGDPDAIRASKRRLCRAGDPDRGEYPEVTEESVLELAVGPPTPGLVRILGNLTTHRYRLLMQDLSMTTLLLNHDLVPGMTQKRSNNSIIYTADDYAVGRCTLMISLTFVNSASLNHFETKFDLGIRANTILLAQLHLALTPVTQQADQRTTVRMPALPGASRFPPTSPLDGILAHLSRQCGGNVHDCGVVDVTSSPPYTHHKAAKWAADVQTNTNFASAFEHGVPHTRNNWICYDFKHRCVVTTHYSLRSWNQGRVGYSNMKSWVLEVSTDGNDWAEVDHRENNAQLNGANATAVFEVVRRERCRFIRLVNIGNSHIGSNQICICSFEIFGRMLG